MKCFFALALFATQTLALRRLRTQTENDDGKKDLFCFAFVMPAEVELPRFEYFERQLKKCDGYGLYSIKDIPEHNVIKVLEKPETKLHDPNGFHRNYMNGIATWSEVVKEAANYKWFFNVHTDTFFRPAKVMAAIQHATKGTSSDIIAVSRPGRNSHLLATSCAVAMSSNLLQKMIANPVADPAKLAADVKGRAAEDRLLNAWIRSVDGTILNTINNDAHGCTSFSSSDRQDLPKDQDLKKMLEGESYTKGKKSMEGESYIKGSESTIPKEFKICYSSDLAAIHPVKDDATFKKLCDELN